jgi:hypothetical protein
MATVLESLRGVNAYPIPIRTIEEVARKRGVDLSDETSIVLLTSRAFRLSEADLLLWLSYAPNVTQGGQSYNFSDEQRARMRARAQQIYDEMDEGGIPKNIYGYKGKRL